MFDLLGEAGSGLISSKISKKSQFSFWPLLSLYLSLFLRISSYQVTRDGNQHQPLSSRRLLAAPPPFSSRSLLTLPEENVSRDCVEILYGIILPHTNNLTVVLHILVGSELIELKMTENSFSTSFIYSPIFCFPISQSKSEVHIKFCE
jgi:hypothetical protein